MRAWHIRPEGNYGVEAVVFGGYETEASLEVQGPFEPGEKYCLVVDSGPTYYGGVRKFRREGNQFHFDVTDEASIELGVEGAFFIEVDREEEDPPLSAIEAAVNQILESTNC